MFGWKSDQKKTKVAMFGPKRDMDEVTKKYWTKIVENIYKSITDMPSIMWKYSMFNISVAIINFFFINLFHHL